MPGIPKAPRLGAILAAQFAASILVLSPVAQSASAPFASKEMRTLDRATIDRITRLLEERIECVMSDQGSLGATLRSVTISADDAVVRVDISKSYLPANVDYMGAGLEDRLTALQNIVLGVIENVLGYRVSQVLFLFDGRPLEFYYPNDFATQTRSAGGSEPLTVMRTWRLLAPQHHASLEVDPMCAVPQWRTQSLVAWVSARGDVSPIEHHGNASFSAHGLSSTR